MFAPLVGAVGNFMESIMDDVNSTIEPMSASADGKRNMYSFTCSTVGQSMNYAACLWRQSVLATPNVKTPQDWEVCDKARRMGTCAALTMRKEEELVGKAIYFTDRNIFRKITDTASRWLMPVASMLRSSDTVRDVFVPITSPKVGPRKKGDMLDFIGGSGDFADAISKAAEEIKTTRPVTSMPIVSSVSGESPLQMARRLAAARTSS